jgi:hypothetical protein
LLAAFINLVTANREAAGDVVVMSRYAGHTLCRSGTAHRRTDRHGVGEGAVGGVEACLDEILALRLGDERLQLCGGESVNQAGFRDDEKENLRSSQGRKLIGLFHDT